MKVIKTCYGEEYITNGSRTIKELIKERVFGYFKIFLKIYQKSVDK